MVEKIFVKSGEKFNPVDLTPFEKEKPLEKIIIENPQLIPLDAITSSPEIEFFPISSQLNTGHGELDIIGVDTYGEIYIIETKLHSNSDRRQVIAQVWDYAGGLSTFSDDFEEFKNRINNANSTVANKKTRLENKTLEQIISEISNSDEETLLKTIQKNFQDSKFTFILVLDKIDEHLKVDLKYLNQTTSNSMYALTLSYFNLKGTSHEIVISDVYGTETVRKNTSSRKREFWELEGDLRFPELINSNLELTSKQKEKVKEFFYDLKKILGDTPNSEDCEIGYYDWGEGNQPRFQARLYEIGVHPTLDYSRSAFKIKENGFIQFAYIGIATPEAKRFEERFTQELRKLPCTKELMRQIDNGARMPNWSPEDWISYKNEFLEIIMNSKTYDEVVEK